MNDNLDPRYPYADDLHEGNVLVAAMWGLLFEAGIVVVLCLVAWLVTVVL
jgi:hypothetical protein